MELPNPVAPEERVAPAACATTDPSGTSGTSATLVAPAAEARG
jgi:hypothetical protein